MTVLTFGLKLEEFTNIRRQAAVVAGTTRQLSARSVFDRFGVPDNNVAKKIL